MAVDDNEYGEVLEQDEKGGLNVAVGGVWEGHAGTLQPTINRGGIAAMSALKAIKLFPKIRLMPS